jgi:hypothetical protein
MEMFNAKVLKQRIGNLKKSKKLNILEQVEEYVISKCKEAGLEHSYDVMAEEMPYFKTMGYTEYGTSFIMQPLNFKLRTEQISDAFYDNDSNDLLDWANYLKDNIINKTANKYSERNNEFGKYPHKNNLVVLPGSNKIKTHSCLNKLKAISTTHKGDIYFKPHPITTHAVIGELKDLFGEESILPRDIDMYYFLEKANKIYSTHISESVLYAVALGKEVEPIDVYNVMSRGSFFHLNEQLYDNQLLGKEWINKTFSSYKSGIINPSVDIDWKKKVDLYIDYIIKKRLKYKDWFISNPEKTKGKK